MAKKVISTYLYRTYHVESTNDILQIIAVYGEEIEIKYLNKDKPVFQSNIKALEKVVGNGSWKTYIIL